MSFDPCAGGHIPFTNETLGGHWCTRCGRFLDLSRCSHGTSRSHCTKHHVDPIRQSLVQQARIYGADPRVDRRLDLH